MGACASSPHHRPTPQHEDKGAQNARRGARVAPARASILEWKLPGETFIPYGPSKGAADTPPVLLDTLGSSLTSSIRSTDTSGQTQSSSSSNATCSFSTTASSPYSPGVVTDDYALGPQLGAGRFGKVVACTRKSDGQELACKLISLASQGAADAAMEVQVLRSMRGQKGIVQLHCVFVRSRAAQRGVRNRYLKSKQTRQDSQHGGDAQQPSNLASLTTDNGGKEIQIVMKRCYGGTLADKLKEQTRLPEKEALGIMESVLETVAVLHAKGFVYRDIKDTNFLFQTTAPDSPLVAVDFGLAATYVPGSVLTEVAGSPLYISPEVIQRAYGPQTDVWSAGVLFHQLLSGCHPFHRGSLTAVLKAVTGDGREEAVDLEGPLWTSVSDATKALLRSMLRRNPAARPTPAQLLEQLKGLLASPDLAQEGA